MPIRRRSIGSSSDDITSALTPGAPTPPRRPRLTEQVAPRPLDIADGRTVMQGAIDRMRARGGPVRLSVNGQEIAVLGDIERESAERQVRFAESVNRMPAGLLAQAGVAAGSTPEDIAELGVGIREAAISQTLAGMRANPMMVGMVRELLNSPDRPAGYDPENDQLALALARYDAENHVCHICDGGPGNENACVCGLDRGPEPAQPPMPSRPVRNWDEE